MKNKYYYPIIIVFVLTIFLTVYYSQKKVKDESNKDEVTELSNGWKKNNETDNKLMIYGTYYLSTDLDSDVYNNYSCQTDDCEFIVGNDNYAIINDGSYLIYNLSNKTIYYLDDKYNYHDARLLVNNDKLYGIIFNDDDREFYYSMETKEYYFLNNNYKIDYNSKYVISNNQLIIIDDDHYSLINYLTGEHLIDSTFIDINYYEDENDYLIVIKDFKDDIINIYNSKLKSISLPIVNLYMLYKDKIVLSSDLKSFVVKNSNNDILKTSREYNRIYNFFNGYIIVELDNNLLIVDTSDKIIKTIPLEGRSYDSVRSCYNKESIDYQEGIYLYVGNDINWQEIYFNPKTFELTETDI